MKPLWNDSLRLVGVLPVSILICWVPYFRWVRKTHHTYDMLSIYTYWWVTLFIKCLIGHLCIHPLYLCVLVYLASSTCINRVYWLSMTRSTKLPGICFVWTLNWPLCFHKRVYRWNKMQGMCIQTKDQCTKQTISFKCPSWFAPTTITNWGSSIPKFIFS